MLVKEGKSVLNGIAFGKIFLFKDACEEPVRKIAEDVQEEIRRFEKAKKEALRQLKILYKSTLEQVGKEQALIFDLYQLMIVDEEYNAVVYKMLREERWTAEYAVLEAGKSFAGMFASLEEEYVNARSADIMNVSKRIISMLAATKPADLGEEPVIILAEDLTPSQTVQFSKDKILAFVTKKGSAASHTTILAKSMNIPSLFHVDIGLLEEYNGREAIADGFTGTFFIDPDKKTIDKMMEKQKNYLKSQEELLEMAGKETVTKSGRRVNLYANIGGADEVSWVTEYDAEGIGLFRSEFIYLSKKRYPKEEEQFEIYKKVIAGMQGKKVIIRILDIGADKQADYFAIEKEENPAMGYRSIRICLDRVDLFKTQLRAIYRAAVFGNTAVMFPMIISLEEIQQIKKIIREVKEDLKRLRIPFGKVELGVMIETPAAVMISDELAEEVEFFSIGTNDLLQYTLAIDRQNRHLNGIYDPHHKAVLKMIRMVIENGHKAGIWVGICGELAADEELTQTFVEMGIDELSVAPSRIWNIRKKIREME